MSETVLNRWFRFRLRTVFIAVTVCGLAIGIWARARRLEALAQFHEQQAVDSITPVFNATRDEQDRMGAERWNQLQSECLAEAQWHQTLSIECRRAIWRPWLLRTSH
jgi:hypothetical protein